MSGFFGLAGYGKEGKGVSKDEPEKRGLFKFFELFMRKFWRYVTLNITYIIACIPAILILFIVTTIVSEGFLSRIATNLNVDVMDVNGARLLVAVDIIIKSFLIILFTAFLGMGPATAGFTYVLRNFAREEHAWVWSDFWEMTFKNFKQGIVVFIVDVVAFILGYVAYNFYGSMPTPLSYMKYFLLVAALVFILMHFYIYPMMVTFKLKLKDIYKNALIFSFAKLPLNLLIMVLVLAVHVGAAYAVIFFGGTLSLLYFIPLLFLLAVLEICIGISFTGFIVNFSVYPVIKQYMLERADVEVKVKEEK